MAKKIINVAIIGAGRIGLYLAWKLSEKGHKVIVFEQKKKLGSKVCSSLISERLKKFIPLDKDLIENKIDFCILTFPKKKIVLKLKPTHLVINRQKLAEKLAKLAKEAGAKIFLGKPINKIPFGFGRIIGCDGALSFVRKSLKLPSPKMQLGIQGFSKRKNYSSNVEVLAVKDGFFWKIPRGKEIEYGFMGEILTANKDFEKILKNLAELSEKEKKEILKTKKSALIPQGLIIPKSKIITLCGDAAGLTKPWSGGGVIWGLTAADILIKNFPDFNKYRKEVIKFFLPKIFKGKLANSLAYFLGNNFPYILPSKITRDNDFPLI